jgi:4-amino-4-deoxy-L-arabinose transferase-like glycosyltransferase
VDERGAEELTWLSRLSRPKQVWAACARLTGSPLVWIVTLALVLHTIGITWGLPASDGWDDDGVAPRDFLVGAYMAFRPGHYFTYPPLHLVILTLLTFPATLLALIRSASLAPPDVIAEITRAPYMTVFAVVARLVTDLMAAGIVYLVASIAKELWGRRAGHWAASVAALNVVFTYYAHTSNLDVPYLFWTLGSYLCLVRAILRHEPARLRGCALLAVFAVATKDQAFAAFLLTFPMALGLWFALDAWPRERARAALRLLAACALGAVVLLALIDGALVNPSGFAARLRFLTGPASQDHAYYTQTIGGMARVVRDTVCSFGRYYPVGLAPFVLYGFGIHLVKTRDQPARRVAGLVPALGVLSFTVAFNCVARRTEHRFVLPQSLFVSVYAGAALDALTHAASRVRVAAWTLAALLGGRALFDCVAVDVALLRDPRYDAEDWLNANVRAGEVIEVYGNNVYLPRLPVRARVQRVDRSALSERSPMPGMREIEAPFEDVDQRRPDWIVISDGWSWRYTIPPPAVLDGSVALSPLQASRQKDFKARDFFASLLSDTGDYAEAHIARYSDRFWPRVDIHASTTRTIYILRRVRR